MASKRYETHCPICGKTERVDHQDDTVRYCADCKFQWSTELNDGVLMALSVARVKEADQ